MALGQNATAYRPRGSNTGVYRLSDSAGSYDGPLVELPIFKETNYGKTINETSIESEGGNVYKRTKSKEFELSGTFIQTDLDTLQLLESLEGEYICAVKEFSIDQLGGKTTYLLAPAAKFKGDYSINMPTAEVPFTLTPEVVTTAVTVDISNFANSKFTSTLTGTVVVPAGKAMVFFEV